MVHFTAKDIPSQTGKIVVVTGATSGIGYETAVYFVKAGATVIVAGRNEAKGKDTLEQINQICPNAKDKVVFGKIDLSDLQSVSEFCAWFLANYQKLDILINNAGVITKVREITRDGFEPHIGTNHLAHFALTAQLLPALRKSPHPRVVTISSLLAHLGKINFDDLQLEKTFKGGLKDYGTSKLANLLFTFELQRRSDEGGWGLIVTAAHPGGASTPMANQFNHEQWAIQNWLTKFMQHSAADAALITMYAATAPESQKSGYYGPQNMFGAKGPPGPAWIPKAAKNVEDARRLWEVSEKLTKVTWPSV